MQGNVKIRIEEDASVQEMEITIRCRQTNESVIRMLEMFRMADRKLTGYRDGQTYLLDVSRILYIDTVEKKTFLYTEEEVYETPLRLYELEGQLAGWDFVRVSKSAIVNFDQVKSLRPDFGGRMRLTMSNGEVVVANRQYVPAIKTPLGLSSGFWGLMCNLLVFFVVSKCTPKPSQASIEKFHGYLEEVNRQCDEKAVAK